MNVKKIFLTAAALLLLSGCAGSENSGDNADKKTQAPRREKSPLVLEAASLEHGAELYWNQERFPDATFTLCILEEAPGADGEDCFFDAESTISNGHTSPLTVTGCSGGRRYWMQLEAEQPSGEVLYSLPIMVTTRVPDEDLLGTDEYDWRNDPDLDAEKQAIAQQVSGFQEALADKNIPAAISLIAEDQQDIFKALFDNNPDAMPAFGALLNDAEMDFLSPPADPEADFSVRTAEYALEKNGFTFYVRWMKDGDTWLLMDF